MAKQLRREMTLTERILGLFDEMRLTGFTSAGSR